MKKLYLHIGLGKTGSSALQSWLSLNSEALSLQGIDYADTVPEVKFGESLSGNGSPLHRACVNQDFDEVENLLTSTYFFRPENDVAIISCELLQGLRPSTIARLKEICENNNIETKVLVYVRSVYEVLYSTYTQFVKRSSYTHRFGEKSSDTDFSESLEYLKRYLDEFGSSMTVLNYDKARMDIYASFSAVTGINTKGLKKLKLKVNRSLSLGEVETLRRVNALHKGVFATQISNFIIAKSPSVQTQVYYDEALLEQVRKGAEEGVQWINEQFSVTPSLVTDFYSDQKSVEAKSPARSSFQPVLQWALDYVPEDVRRVDFALFLKEFAAFMVEFSSEDALALIRRASAVQQEITNASETSVEVEDKPARVPVGPRYLMTYFHDADSPDIERENSQFASNFYAWLDLIESHTVGSTINPVENTETLGAGEPVLAERKPPMSGYSIVEADNIDTVLSLAEKCPLLEIGGVVEVSHIIQLHQAYMTKPESVGKTEEG
jgi:hypothetical protein